jgi:tetratricopeptide (TPR) repeat protein
MQIWIFLLTTAALVFSRPLLALPQAVSNLSVSGYVRDEVTQEALSAASLELKRASGVAAAPTAISGVTGEFHFEGLTSTDYYLIANLKGYETLRVEISVRGVSRTNLVVVMHKLERVQPDTLHDPISAHQLQVSAKAREAYEKGVLLLSKKADYAGALAEFERAVREASAYYEAFTEMGVAQVHLGDTAAAERSLRRAVELSQRRFDKALFLLAALLNDRDRFAEAEPVARDAVAAASEAWQGNYELARALAGQKHSEEAETYAVKAKELNPENAQTYLVLGNVHIQEHKYAEVLVDFDTYLRLAPPGAEADMVRRSREQVARAVAGQQH